jgi:hypothetical protein
VQLASKAEPPVQSSDSDARTEARSNIYVAAKIASAEACGPVCIRNLSATGALIEGGVLPPQGSRIRVSRGSLSTTGTIAWREANRAGVRFDSAVSVAAWLPRGPRTQQQRIDEAVHAFKNGSAPLSSVQAAANSGMDIANELRDLEQKLRAVAEQLSGDVLVCERHLAAVQVIDIATNRLAELATKAD